MTGRQKTTTDRDEIGPAAIRWCDVATPVGPVRVAATADDRAVVVAFADHFDRVAAPVHDRLTASGVDVTWEEGPTGVSLAVERYVAGHLDALDGITVDVTGTPFRHRVWDALRAIPVGRTCSYAAIASAIGAPDAVRAVGSANGANPVWLVVPCHRVVRSDGSLGGYGGGVERKAWLLAHEQAADDQMAGAPAASGPAASGPA